MDYRTFQVLEELRTRAQTTQLQINKILALLQESKERETKLMATAQEVLDAVEPLSTVSQSVITLLDQIKAALDSAGTDQAKLEQVKIMIDGNKEALAAAVERNT